MLVVNCFLFAFLKRVSTGVGGGGGWVVRGSTCRLSVKISLLCRLSVKIFDLCRLSVNLG